MRNPVNFSGIKREFYFHLATYIIVMTFLVVVNLTTSPVYFWAKWPMMGWGLAVVLHALNVFVFTDRSTYV